MYYSIGQFVWSKHPLQIFAKALGSTDKDNPPLRKISANTDIIQIKSCIPNKPQNAAYS